MENTETTSTAVVKPVPEKASFFAQMLGLPGNFWCACFMEILERLAFFGSRAVAPLFLVASSGENGLGLNYKEKGIIYTVWALLQCLVPMVSGGYTDRYGYRKSLCVAFVINILGYTGMALSGDIASSLSSHGWESAGFWVFLAAACMVAVGTAIFKPPAHGTIAAATTEETSSMGWGIFYWVVNIGGAIAPMGAATLRGEIDWHIVFYAAAVVTALNFIPAFIWYREPKKQLTEEQAAEPPKNVFQVFAESVTTIFKDIRLVIFLGIFSCFWLMFMQLWDLLPNFIDEWIDTADVAPIFAWFSDTWTLGSGQVKPEMIINIDAIAIIALVMVVSWIIRKINKVVAMVIGMVISLVGFIGTGSTMLGWMCCLMVFIFSIGEMACSPTFSAYVGLIAPKGKKALYMGYSNIPFAIGWALGNLIGGYIYEDYGAKANLAAKELASQHQLVAQAAKATDWSASLGKLPFLLDVPQEEAFEMLAAEWGRPEAEAADALRTQYRHDVGQTENLALQHLALQAENRAKLIEGLAASTGEGMADNAQKYFAAEVAARLKTEAASTQPTSDRNAEISPAEDDTQLAAADSDLTTAARVRQTLTTAQETLALVQALVKEEATLAESHPARWHFLIPAALGIDRGAAVAKIRDELNEDKPEAERVGETAVIDMLWETYGKDPDVLDNLALEYLAQRTDRLQHRIEKMRIFASADDDLARVQEIRDRFGMDAGHAFAALSTAVGGDQSKVDGVLEENGFDAARPTDVYLYLMTQGEHRFDAVSQIGWKENLGLLREAVRGDENALEIVKSEIDETGLLERIVNLIKGIFAETEYKGEVTEEGVNYYKLAQKSDLIQKAMAARDWRNSPELAGQVLRMSVPEARLLIAADPQKAKEILWDKYDPYMVWYYLGGFGLLGTFGMIVFYYATRKQVAAEQANGGA